MSVAHPSTLRVAVVGGGPAGSFFALYALQYARLAGREVAITLYEGKDFRRFGQPGCNMCAGIVIVSVLAQLEELGVAVPPELVLSHIRTYALHTSAGTLVAAQPDPHSDIISVYRGTGPRYGHPPELLSFDELLLELAVARGARLRRAFAQAVRHGPPVEVVCAGEAERYDLVVLACGVNGPRPALEGFAYRPPPTGRMCQAEVHLGREEVEARLGSCVHIFLPPDDIATCGTLVPKGPFVTVSLLGARDGMRGLRRFLELAEVRAVLGPRARPVCGCLPSISLGPARGLAADGFVAVGDAGTTRLYKNGIGSALATARAAARAAVCDGPSAGAFRAGYLPLCRAIEADNRMGRLLFLEGPLLKHVAALPRAHARLAADGRVGALHARLLWGMFTGASSYRELFRMATSPALLLRLARATLGALRQRAPTSLAVEEAR